MKIPHGIVAVVTGGGSGLGRAFCERLAAAGAKLVVADIDLGSAEATVELLRYKGAGASIAVECDVTRLDSVQALRESARALGSVTLVINNAGVAVAGNLLDVPEVDLEWVMNVNLWGVRHGCRVFGPDLVAKGGGYILNIASAAGLLNPPTLGAYNITKAGVVALSETLNAELKDAGVRVCVVCPSFFQTGILERARGSDAAQSKLVAGLMQRSRVQAPEVAERALACVLRGELYCVPMLDARGFWALKRAFPRGYASLAARLARAAG